MNRRKCFEVLAAAGVAGQPALAQAAAPRPIQLHVDLNVDPAKERDLTANFRKVFRPAISKQPGFVEVRLLKLRKPLAGPGPGEFGHRLIISFQTEELRQKWVATDDHQRAWPTIEQTLRGAKYTAVLYDTL